MMIRTPGKICEEKNYFSIWNIFSVKSIQTGVKRKKKKNFSHLSRLHERQAVWRTSLNQAHPVRKKNKILLLLDFRSVVSEKTEREQPIAAFGTVCSTTKQHSSDQSDKMLIVMVEKYSSGKK